MNLSPLPIQKFFDNNGRPLVRGLLFTYEAGTSIKVATYVDSTGVTQNTNPIVLDFRGECRLWLDPQQAYKFVLAPRNDTDPPTHPIWTVDNITVAPQAFDNAAVDTGSVNNISLSIPQISSPVAFTRIVFEAANTNTGPTTLQINGGTALPVVLPNGDALEGEQIQAGGIYEAVFDGGQWQLISDHGEAGIVASDPAKYYRQVMSVIRNDGSGWAFINDADHTPIGFSSVTVVGDNLRLTYSFTSSKVYSLGAWLDETMSSQGLFIGPSVGLTFSDFRVYMPLSFWVEKTGGTFQFQDIPDFFNAGVTTTISTSGDQSSFTVTHKTASADQPPFTTILPSGASDVSGYEARPSYGGTSITVQAYNDFCGYISYNGAAWVVETDNIAVPTAVFAAGVLTVTHQKLNADNKGLNATVISGVYVGAPGSTITQTTFTYAWYDYAGANIVVPNTNMKVRYHRPVKVLTKAPDGMRVSVQRGPVILAPNDIVSLNGNFWIMGVLAP